MKRFHSNSALLAISSFLLYNIFIFYLVAQKHSGNVIIENISGFNITCLMLSLIPFYLKRLNKDAKNSNEPEKKLTIYEEKKQFEELDKKLSESPQLRKMSYLISALYGFWMAGLLLGFILMIDK